MKELISRNEAIKHLNHHGKSDPNLYIYNQYKQNGMRDKAERFLKYRHEWEQIRLGNKVSDFPPHVAFALNNSCNLTCAHCYRTFNKSRSAKNRLSPDEVRRLVDECQQIGVYSIGLGTESEMFLYRGIDDVMRYISEKDFDDFWVCTNGTLLTEKQIELILDSNVTRLSISLDAVSPQTYQKSRGDGFYRVMRNIFSFLEKRNCKKLKLPAFRVTCIKSNITSHEIEGFINFWRNIADEVDIQPLIDVKNIDQLKYDVVDNPACTYPNSMLYINWNGDFKPCCSEFCKHLTIGNIDAMGILEAWRTPYMKDLRRQFADKRVNRFCTNCLRSLQSNAHYEPNGEPE